MVRLKDFDIIEVAERLGLQFVKKGPGDERIYRCPFCGDSTKHPNKGHLYVNARTGVFKCHRCGEEGNAVTMWAKYHRVDAKTAYRQLRDGEFPECVPVSGENGSGREDGGAGIDERDRVYRKFLELLKLDPPHKADLLRRGLSEVQIHNNLYKSVPQDARFRWRVTRYLLEKGCSLKGIPGFFTRNGRYGPFWDFVSPAGYLIPVKDVQGRIQALQVRLDEGKYIWFSSHGMPNGTSSKAPTHYTGGKGKVWVTEGPLKADVASALLNAPFVGIPGVGAWKDVDGILEVLSCKDPVVAFDADCRTNPNVAKALGDFIRSLKQNGYRPLVASWPASYGKGIDDVFLKLHREEVSSVTLTIEGVPVTIRRTVTTVVSVGK
ncbi:DNA primase [Desulfofundulus kuznetsovii DSM 6115]|uniref:DNA primase n=1 Tax=Desulfofundulus kuznetsovii (strain DSM 6115 / VKM B-1805 / 17) TaxID=760568 RepID=A0AAU8P999_DESK7|nr:DNA primase [Desulfofundulus kuznetsovii DSM 6115]